MPRKKLKRRFKTGIDKKIIDVNPHRMLTGTNHAQIEDKQKEDTKLKN